MKYTEKTSVSPITGEYRFIERINDDGTITIIPMDEANSDYQAYLNPVEHLTEIPTV